MQTTWEPLEKICKDLYSRKEWPLPLPLEKCCFYVNQWGIIEDKIWQLQTDLKKPKE